ncbi:MAG: hypothetical protein KIT84_39925 [Labilithrix sp.]|nr:hypothetical protein [Labilithrix sp.]MCW5817234.1 hypothetical protein [Labilithrix sp.]
MNANFWSFIALPTVSCGGALFAIVSCSSGIDFDPSDYDTTCATASDCMLVVPMADCFRCCSETVAVKGTSEVAEDQRAAEESCRVDGVDIRECGIGGCEWLVAVCEEGRCRATMDFDAGM